MLTNIYRNLVPYSFRVKVYHFFLGSVLTFFRNIDVIVKSKFIFLFQWILPKTEQNKAYSFMGLHGLTAYPSPYSLEYRSKKIVVEFDSTRNLPYVIHNGKKLYFPEKFDNQKVTHDYLCLIMEQDRRSAHRYVRSYDELKGKTLFDIGSAEGIFALDTIELVDHVYLFEYEDYWIKALEATFAPWSDKVSLIKRYVNDFTDLVNLKIDDFLVDKSKDNLFLKMDIEGAEMSALKGAEKTLIEGKNNCLAVTTYHKVGDPEAISNYLASLKFNFEFSDGLIYWSKRVSKGVVRCQKIA